MYLFVNLSIIFSTQTRIFSLILSVANTYSIRCYTASNFSRVTSIANLNDLLQQELEGFFGFFSILLGIHTQEIRYYNI
jgi:hypothetical protein